MTLSDIVPSEAACSGKGCQHTGLQVIKSLGRLSAQPSSGVGATEKEPRDSDPLHLE